ncbi:MAG: sulfurtransferase [Nakamurella sp.]
MEESSVISQPSASWTGNPDNDEGPISRPPTIGSTTRALPIISAGELAEQLNAEHQPALSLLDVRWTLAGSDRDGYLAGHLPGARYIDLDRELAGPAGLGGRHPLPEPGELEQVWRAAGLSNDSRVVVYDGGPGLAAARAWWLLRWSGLHQVRVLDGGLPAWTADPDRPTGAGPEPIGPPGSMIVTAGSMPAVDADQAAAIAGSRAALLIDARAAARFRGDVEPLDPVAGHIPGSVNLPIGELLTPAGTFRPAAELAARFAAVNVIVADGGGSSAAGGMIGGGSRDGGYLAVASCGSGITACQLILAGKIAGLSLALYPGSYSQWCALDRPVAQGD